MSARVALATEATFPQLARTEGLAIPALADLGIEGVPAVWDDPGVDWRSFEAVIIRSTWDYTTRLEQFLDWLGQLQAWDVAVYNDPTIIGWNCEKTYLEDLRFAGVKVPDTVWIERNGQENFSEVMADKGWAEAIIKPAVSAGARRTYRVRADQAEEGQRYLDEIAAHGMVMVQEYLPSIEEGEWALLYFNNAFSHALLKRPASGDFRVQVKHGGTNTLAMPPAHLIETGQQILAAMEKHTGHQALYARVDGVAVEDSFVLMELEVIEPDLFLGDDPEAPARFAAAIKARLKQNT
jgi:glutathione synthase/RimK-type ligase-like ATP-grasp enzyme